MFLAPRVNKPPRADISPKEQTITLPTNEVVLDGSSECYNYSNVVRTCIVTKQLRFAKYKQTNKKQK